MKNRFQSKIGLRPVYSTKDPHGNPATLGEPFAETFRDNFTIVEDELQQVTSTAENAEKNSGNALAKAQEAEDIARTVDSSIKQEVIFETGLALGSSGDVASNSGYDTSSYVRVVKGYRVIYSGVTGAGTTGLFLYSDDKGSNPVMLIGNNQNLTDYIVDIVNDGYIRASGRNQSFTPKPIPLTCVIYPNYYEQLGFIDDKIQATNQKWQVNISFTDGLALLSSNGTTTSNASYSTSDFIAVKKGFKIRYTGNTGNIIYAKYAFYDANKNFISAYTVTGANTDLDIEIPERVAYIRLCGHANHAIVGHVKAYIILSVGDLTRQVDFEVFRDKTDNEIIFLKDKWKSNISFTNGVALLTASGATISNSGYATSDFVSTKTGDIFYYSGLVGNTTVYANAVFYDSDKNLISVLGFGGGSNYPITVPVGVAYVRFCGYMDNATYGKITVYQYGSSSEFVGINTFNSETHRIDNEVEKLKGSLSSPVIFLDDYGYLNSTGGVTWLDNAYKYRITDFIPIVAGDKIIYTGTTGGGTWGLWFYDANKNPISAGVVNNVSLVEALITAPEGTAYCRISGRGISPLIVEIISNIIGSIAELNVAVHKLISNGGSTKYEGQTLGVLGDSTAAQYYSSAEIVVAAEDVGRQFSCYVSPYDIANWAASGNPKPQKNKKIYSCIIPSGMVGKILSLNITSEDVGLTLGGKTIQSSDIGNDMDFTLTTDDINKQVYGVKITQPMTAIEFTFIASNDDVGLVLGEPRGYLPNNISKTAWFNIIANKLGMEVIGSGSISGSTYTRLAANKYDNFCSQAWHPQTVRRCGKRDLATGERIAPDNIIVYRVINDWSKNTYSYITDFDPYKNLYPDDDYVDDSITKYDFKKGICKTVQEIRKQYPKARIWLCTTFHNMYRGQIVEGDPENPLGLPFPPTNGEFHILEYNKAIREVADAYGCDLIEFDKSGITYENILDFSGDGVHPDTAGNALMGARGVADMSAV
ncbi:MAG: SGNH/GDSL hydrolase family protein [Dysgonomonas sp.]|nr:SGNH/GDSL hydrolase family protein [Dysgonomonas sp.]